MNERHQRYLLAMHLYQLGFSVIPLHPATKLPACKWKLYQTERCTAKNLWSWFNVNDFWPAIVTGQLSGITVIDCDDPEAAEVAKINGLASHITQRTSRGLHFVFRHKGERNTVRLCGAKIDRRGEGGYIKAYPDALYWSPWMIERAPALTPPIQSNARC